ncbi:hypothetical protein PAE3005 [Pyrobaculum aerophilum str. IM2]|uniref:Uncharacterized protein n=1 Tax=Pyrobaculum aerophilum (strain ATCC 51768 / DSM 7523 / JCM 9630 / CIP 104966 / NBRC 100827 / IM2) TaxID=178306 RepID=Q8ZU04_PYRAE|nr:hypothetical protein PAE3005 [Pyrobaculum aerophilum str. IM2]
MDFLEAIAPKLPEFWLPLPVELCRGRPVELGPLEGYLEPLLNLYYEVRANWRCYSSAEELKRREMAAVKLAALVLKARVYGRVDLREWDAYFSHTPRPPPKPSLVLGAPRGEEVVICGTYPPNPIEVAYEIWGQLAPTQRLELAKWIVKYIAFITESINLDEAYYKLLREGWLITYRTFKWNSPDLKR